jgi:ABC-2 type transport system ATP-binding protein
VEIRFRLPDGVAIDAIPAADPSPTMREDGLVAFHTDRPVEALNQLTGWALERGLALDDLEVVRPNLEDVYLRLTSAQ